MPLANPARLTHLASVIVVHLKESARQTTGEKGDFLILDARSESILIIPLSVVGHFPLPACGKRARERGSCAARAYALLCGNQVIKASSPQPSPPGEERENSARRLSSWAQWASLPAAPRRLDGELRRSGCSASLPVSVERCTCSLLPLGTSTFLLPCS